MPGLNGLDAAVRILKQSPSVRLIILSMYTNEDYVRQALSVGASGYLQKGADPAELELAIKAVMRNETYLTPAVSKQLVQEYLHHGGNKLIPVQELTPRQREVLQLIAEGHSTKDMAQRLSVSVKTIETHRMDIKHRLGIHDVAGLVRYAIRVGLITSDS
jgi:DNA-binding NarL/FixJ family response regulator